MLSLEISGDQPSGACMLTDGFRCESFQMAARTNHNDPLCQRHGPREVRKRHSKVPSLTMRLCVATRRLQT